MDQNLDAMNVAECMCEGFIHKLAKNKVLTKDELLTYNSALRMLKAIFDNVSESLYQKENEPEDGESEVTA